MAAHRLALLSLHQRDATLDERERLTALAEAAPPHERLVALLTCHRAELYAVIPFGVDPREGIASLLAARAHALGAATVRCDDDAAAHLFRVAAGLDSAVVGEAQIAGQLRRTFDTARRRGVDPILAGLLQRALHLARVVRSSTELGSVRASLGSLAVDEALRHVSDPARVTAVVVGAGEIGKLAARALARRVGRLVIANRDPARADGIAGPIGATAIGMPELATALADADVLISAADTRGTLLTRELLAARVALGALVVIDMAVPRSLAPDARDLAGVVYRDVDDLAGGATVDASVVADAERRCAAEAAAFMRWADERERAATVRALHGRADAIRERQLARAMRHLRHLPERDREVVAALASSLTHALLHEPTVRLRGDPDAERAARVLFGIEA